MWQEMRLEYDPAQLCAPGHSLQCTVITSLSPQACQTKTPRNRTLSPCDERFRLGLLIYSPLLREDNLEGHCCGADETGFVGW
jgi:hypothetical protein